MLPLRGRKLCHRYVKPPHYHGACRSIQTATQSLFDMTLPPLKLNDYDISFSQLYPIHRSELPLYSEIGLEAFWKHPGFDLEDPKRRAIQE